MRVRKVLPSLRTRKRLQLADGSGPLMSCERNAQVLISTHKEHRSDVRTGHWSATQLIDNAPSYGPSVWFKDKSTFVRLV